MSNSNERRKQQLGMPYGTASNKLRKMLMFKFAQELGYDDCFACGGKINTPDELSVEHKEPWESRPNGVEKFWDLDNIAFSHRACNIAHVRKGGLGKRKVGPEGTAWCHDSEHKEFVSVDSFWKGDRYNGVQSSCIDCMKKRRQ